MKNRCVHEYIHRESGEVRQEALIADDLVGGLYGRVRENAPWLFRALTGARASSALAWLNYDAPFSGRVGGARGFLRRVGVDLSECLVAPEALDTPRKVFERRIRYWDCRPMPAGEDVVASPADCRVVLGSSNETRSFFIKEKFFTLTGLLAKEEWINCFQQGDFAICRLTPDKYHYNHCPVSGRVLDFYEIDGACHACNPTAVVAMATPYSTNRRAVTVIDTDIDGGSRVGLVAMVEVVALMIGQVEQACSACEYEDPQPVSKGMWLKRGQPKSLYRPGSSTDVLLFEPGRVEFAGDLVENQRHPTARSRFSEGFGKPLVETEIQVRSALAFRAADCRNTNTKELVECGQS